MKSLKIDEKTYEKIQEIRKNIALREGKASKLISDDKVVKELISRRFSDKTYSISKKRSSDSNNAPKGTDDPWARGYAEIRNSDKEL